MADASSPVIGVARVASSVVMDSAAVQVSPVAMTFVAARSAGELSLGTIFAVVRWADGALREVITSTAEPKARDPSVVGRASAVERRACDLLAGSPTAEEGGVRVAGTPEEDTDK
jgi:hypothetical protein